MSEEERMAPGLCLRVWFGWTWHSHLLGLVCNQQSSLQALHAISYSCGIWYLLMLHLKKKNLSDAHCTSSLAGYRFIQNSVVESSVEHHSKCAYKLKCLKTYQYLRGPFPFLENLVKNVFWLNSPLLPYYSHSFLYILPLGPTQNTFISFPCLFCLCLFFSQFLSNVFHTIWTHNILVTLWKLCDLSQELMIVLNS